MAGPVDEPPNVLYTGQIYSLEQTIGFDRWLKTLRDREGQLRIRKRLVRLSNGYFGDCRSVGAGVQELRLFFGPGYRVYFARRGDVVILLLAGGDKDSQANDIARAKTLTEEFDGGNENDPL